MLNTKMPIINLAALMALAVPAGLLSFPRAEASGAAAEQISALTTAVAAAAARNEANFEKAVATIAAARADFDAMKGKVDALDAEKLVRIEADANAAKDAATAGSREIKDLRAELDKLSMRASAGGLSEGRSDESEDVKAYRKAFNTMFRKGEEAVPGGAHALRTLEVKAALSSQSNPDGGFTVTPEMEAAIDATVKEVSPMRQICTVRPVGTASYKKLVNTHGTSSGWVGETDPRSVMTATSQLSELEYPVMEMWAMPAATQSLLDDSTIDISAWIGSETELEFAQQEGAAVINGNGIKKPLGLLGGYSIVADSAYAWKSLGYIATGASGAFASSAQGDALVNLYHAPKTAYRTNAQWIMNRNTLSAVRKLKDGQGNYLVNLSYRNDGLVEEVLGKPVVEMPDMPDIAANSFAIAFGDFKRGYIIVDRKGITVLRDPYTQKPYVMFYTTKRVGGGVQNFEAIKLLKFAAS